MQHLRRARAFGAGSAARDGTRAQGARRNTRVVQMRFAGLKQRTDGVQNQGAQECAGAAYMRAADALALRGLAVQAERRAPAAVNR